MAKNKQATVGWQEYLDAQMSIRRDYVNSRFANIQDHEKEMRERMDDLATRTHSSIDRTRESFRLALEAFEQRMNDKFDAKEKASEKADEVAAERLGRMDSFRDRITADASLYVTRDQLDLTFKARDADINLLKTAVSTRSGQEGGVSKLWFVIVSVFAMLGGVGAVISAGVNLSRTVN